MILEYLFLLVFVASVAGCGYFASKAERAQTSAEEALAKAIRVAKLAQQFADKAKAFSESSESNVALSQGYLSVANRAGMKAQSAADDARAHADRAESHASNSSEHARIALLGAQTSARRPIRSEVCTRCTSNVVKFTVGEAGVVCANCDPEAYLEAQRG